MIYAARLSESKRVMFWRLIIEEFGVDPLGIHSVPRSYTYDLKPNPTRSHDPTN